MDLETEMVLKEGVEPVEAAANAVKKRGTLKIKDFYVRSDNFCLKDFCWVLNTFFKFYIF